MINIPWLPVEGETCHKRKGKRWSHTYCELPPNHQKEYVGGLIYPWHLGRDTAKRWHSWR